jgi:signal transduction histidine kinase
MLLLSLDWKILAANKALADFFQLPQTEFSGDNWGSVQLDESPNLLRTLGFSLDGLKRECHVLLTGDSVERKFDFSIPGQQTRFFERTLAPVYDHENQVIGWLIVYREVTEEIELAKLREDMTHMLVHDLRSPLAALQGSLWVIRRKLNLLPEDDNTLRMISIAERNSQSMIKMVESLLDIARLEDGDMPLLTELVAVPQLFEDILSRVSQLYTDANVHVESVVDPGLPKLEVDRDHIQRVLLNLLDNAIKFTPDGGRICIWARMDDEGDTPGVLIGVRDSGPGISKSTQTKLFQKFHTDSSIQGRRRGTGLGLAYCKLAVEAHGGDMWLESQEGQGSTFLMRLPAVVE